MAHLDTAKVASRCECNSRSKNGKTWTAVNPAARPITPLSRASDISRPEESCARARASDWSYRPFRGDLLHSRYTYLPWRWILHADQRRFEELLHEGSDGRSHLLIHLIWIQRA